MRPSDVLTFALLTAGLVAGSVTPAVAQTCQPAPAPEVLLGGNGSGGAAGRPVISPESAGTRASFIVEHPPDYVIGADDILTVNFWRDDEMSNDVVVRPDGKISLPLVNDIQAAGLTPMQLCEAVTVAAKQYLEAPTVSIVVKQINSRRVYIIGQVGKTGPYPMSASMTVMELIAMAGGVAEFADKKNILVVRKEAGKDISYRVNYEEISKGRNLGQNIELRPGDIVIVR